MMIIILKNIFLIKNKFILKDLINNSKKFNKEC